MIARKFKLNKKKLKEKGYYFENKAELLDCVQGRLEWLSSHNKNYTKTQFYFIESLKEIFDYYEITEN